MKQQDKVIFKALTENNVLTESELSRYSSEAQSQGDSLKDYLLAHELITEDQILISLSQTLNIPTFNISESTIEPSVIERVPIKFAWYYKFVPIKYENDTLTIARSLPLELKTQDDIRVHLGMDINSVLIKENELNEALKKYYGFASETIDRIITKNPNKVPTATSVADQWIEDIEHKTDDPTVSNLVNQIIFEAYRKRATDIHIEPYRDKVRFRYRIDGVLIDARLPENVRHFLQPILSRIKIMANLSITEKRLPQDGSAVVKTKEQNLDLRVSTMPTPRGESMVIRILPTKVMLFSLEKLGFDDVSVVKFRHLLKIPHGIIFMTGPTGSGKTTTLYACLNEINSSRNKIITIEDPVEYEMDGITQIQVNPKVNFSFSNGLRSLLRHDPDIIMVGEVRDLETAEIAIRTALTGHLVFSTLHTNDAASGITRLIDMGVEPYLVASSVEAYVAQRLVRVVCPKCKEEDDSAMVNVREEIARALKIEKTQSIRIYKGKGCDYCNKTGFFGRIAIYEILILNDVIRAAILEKPRSDYIKRIAMQEGLITLRQNGWKAVLDGITTPGEVLNVTVKDEYDKLEKKTGGDPSLEDAQQYQIVREQYASETKIDEDHNARMHTRIREMVEIRYRLTIPDPTNPKTLFYDGVEYTAHTKDISAGGLRFLSKEKLSIGSILEIKFHLEENNKNISCLARVCRAEEDVLDDKYMTVISFLNLSNSERSLIKKHIDLKLKNEAKSIHLKTTAAVKEN